MSYAKEVFQIIETLNPHVPNTVKFKKKKKHPIKVCNY